MKLEGMGGGQFKPLIQQILDQEGQPVRQLEARKLKEEAKLKLFQDFKTKFQQLDRVLKPLSTPRQFREFKVDLGAGKDLVSVTLDKDLAEPGQYELEVEALAQRSALISQGFSSEETFVGSGFLLLENAETGQRTEIPIADDQGTLRGLARAINQHPSSPVRAAIIQDASDPALPWKLLMTAKKEGVGEQIDFPSFYLSGGEEDFFIDEERSSQNATLLLDGFEIEAPSNQISNFLPGVNLKLLQKKEDSPFILSITEDYEKMTSKVQDLIQQINPVLEFIIKQNMMDDKTDTSVTFGGDTSLQMVEYQIRQLIHAPYAVVESETEEEWSLQMGELGIEFDKNGLLTFKPERFQKQMEDRPGLVFQAISGPEGFVNKLAQLTFHYTRLFGGGLALKEQGLRSRMDDLDRQIDQKSRYLDQRKQHLIQQFSRLESTLAGLQNQQASLGAVLPGAGAGMAQLIAGVGG